MFVRLFVCSFVLSFVRSFVLSLVNSFVRFITINISKVVEEFEVYIIMLCDIRSYTCRSKTCVGPSGRTLQK